MSCAVEFTSIIKLFQGPFGHNLLRASLLILDTEYQVSLALLEETSV